MKTAFFTYPSAFQNVGGGEIVLLKLREYLSKSGTPVDLFDPWKSRVEDYDVLHVFGSVKDCLGLVQVANARGVKVVTSPVLWSAPTDLPSLMRHSVKVVFPAFPSLRRELLMRSDMLFPNSEMEKKHIARYFAVPEEKMRVVYNGVDKNFAAADASLWRARYGGEPFVLSVGRIEPRKNQLNLIRAMKNMGLKLVLIGDPVTGYGSYDTSCRAAGAGFAEFIPALPHGDPLLKSAYAACSLFVLQGWFETPGLAALEAALAGALIVVTQGGSTREYFGSLANYLDPASVSSIQKSIRTALARTNDGRLKEHVSSRFTWDKIAQSYAELYREVSAKK